MSARYHLPEIGWPVYDLRRRKFGICIDTIGTKAVVHVEGDLNPVTVSPEMKEYEYPEFYMNDEVTWMEAIPDWPYVKKDPGYFIKHVHYHVPKDEWQYTIAKQGVEGFDRFTVTGKELDLITRFIPKI